jgi:hypothetical protein
MRAGPVGSEGQTIGERAPELSQAEAAVDEAAAGAVDRDTLVSYTLVPEGLMSERGPSLGESLSFGPPAASKFEDAAQDIRTNLAPPAQVRSRPVEEEIGRPPSALEPAPVLGWLSDMALSSAALGSLVFWHWRRAERTRPPFPARRWGLDLKRPFALEIEKLPLK